MKTVRNIAFCLLVVCFLALSGCDKKADESKSLNKGGRIDGAKWLEGKTMMGTIGTAIRLHGLEKGQNERPPRTLGELGFSAGDLKGVYFGEPDFTFSVSSMNPLAFIIVCTPGSKPNAPAVPAKMTLNQAGNWTSD